MGGALSSGFPALDTALEGGFPRSVVSALEGDPSLTLPTLRSALVAQQREEGSGLAAWVGPGFDAAAFARIGGDPDRVLVAEGVLGAERLLSLVRLDLMVVMAPSFCIAAQLEATARASAAAVVVASENDASWGACALVCLLVGRVERVEATVALHRYSLGAHPRATYDASEPTDKDHEPSQSRAVNEFYNYDPFDGFSTHGTAEEAAAQAERSIATFERASALRNTRRLIEDVEWGRLVPLGVVVGSEAAVGAGVKYHLDARIDEAALLRLRAEGAEREVTELRAQVERLMVLLGRPRK